MLRARRFLVSNCISLCAHLILGTAQKSRHCSDRHSTRESIPQKNRSGFDHASPAFLAFITAAPLLTEDYSALKPIARKSSSVLKRSWKLKLRNRLW
jgi:hypothetical protein